MDPSQITSPIALAALAVMGVVAIIELLVRSSPRKDLRSIVHWVFISACFITVAVLVYLVFQTSFRGEIRIAGTVTDTAGAPIENATVTIVDVGSEPTSRDGAFKVLVPVSRQAPSYTLLINAKGYAFKPKVLEGPSPKAAQYVMTPVGGSPLSLNSDSVTVGHHLGMPYVKLRALLSNLGATDIQVSEISLNLISPNATEYRLPPVQVDSPLGPMLGVALPSYSLQPKASNDWVFWFVRIDPSIYSLAPTVNKEFWPTPGQMPDPNVARFSDETTQKLQALMERNFVWVDGSWTLVLSARIDSKTVSISRKFSVSTEVVEKMKRIKDLYATGIGVLNQWVVWNSGPIASEAVLPLQN